jgi:hypothetical protein
VFNIGLILGNILVIFKNISGPLPRFPVCPLLGHVFVLGDEEDAEVVVDGAGQLERVQLVEEQVEVVDQDPPTFLPAVEDLCGEKID